MTGIVYQIKNKTTGDCYIGITKNFKSRKYGHFNKLRNNKHNSKKMQQAFNKDNNCLEMKILLKIKIKNDDELNNIERHYILKYKPKYNVRIPSYRCTQTEINNVFHVVNL